MLNDRDDRDRSVEVALSALRPAQRTDAAAAGGSRTQAQDEPAAEGRLEAPAHDERPVAEGPGRPADVAPVHAATPQSAPGAARGRTGTLIVGGLLAALLAGSAGFLYLDHAARFQSTDDAFVAARPFSIAPKVGGYFVDVPVSDNQHVKAGDLIARIDDRDYRNAVALAEAEVAAAEAGVRTVDAQRAAQRAQIEAAQAQVAQARAALVFAGQQADRYRELQKSGSGTVLSAQQSSSQLNQQQAAVQAAEATLTLAGRQAEALDAQRASAEASLAKARAGLDQAKLDLSRTVVTAAQPGRVAGLTAAVGQLAQPGAGLATFVPDGIWVVANFKETQLAAMRPGQPVELSIDAFPRRTLRGHVDSIQPGSGTAFSLLPAENATGNYVKIVQRVPVKVIVDDLPGDVTLGPGQSVVPTVRTDPAPSWFERMKSALERFGNRT